MTGSGRIVLTVLVRNEADIIGDMVRWHLNHGVDYVIAMDNSSNDGTTEILEDYAGLGVLTRIHQPSDAYLQHAWATEMALMAYEDHGADWVIPSDADEFWMPNEGEDLREALATVQPGRDLLRCARRNLIAPREDLGQRDWSETALWYVDAALKMPAERLQDPRPLDYPFLYHQLPSKVLLRPRYLKEITRGAHSARFSQPIREADAPITVYHVPFRNAQEFATSVDRIADAVMRDPAASPKVSAKYRRWAKMPAEAALAEAVPSAERLHRDFRAKRVAIDTRLRDGMARDRGDAPARHAFARARDAVPHSIDGGAAPVPILVFGGNEADRAAVAARLRAVGARCPEPDSALRFAALHTARLAGKSDPITTDTILREIQVALTATGTGGHGQVIADAGLAANLDLWARLEQDGAVAPIVFLLADGENDTVEAAAVEAATEGWPRLAISSSRVLAATPEALRCALAEMGLWIPWRIAAEAGPGAAVDTAVTLDRRNFVGLGLRRGTVARSAPTVTLSSPPSATGIGLLLLGPPASGSERLAQILYETEIAAPVPKGTPSLTALLADLLDEAAIGSPDWGFIHKDSLGPRRALYRDEIALALRPDGEPLPRIALADPAITRLVPLHTEALKAAGYAPRFIHTVYNAEENVAAMKMAGIPETVARLVWLHSHLNAERQTRGYARVFISFEEISDNGPALAKRLEALRADAFAYPSNPPFGTAAVEPNETTLSSMTCAAQVALAAFLRNPWDDEAMTTFDYIATVLEHEAPQLMAVPRTDSDIPTPLPKWPAEKPHLRRGTGNDGLVLPVPHGGKAPGKLRDGLGNDIEFHVLHVLSRMYPVLPKRMTDRFARSARKRDRRARYKT